MLSNGLSCQAAYVLAPLIFSDRSLEYVKDAKPLNVSPFVILAVISPLKEIEEEFATDEVSLISLIMLKPLGGGGEDVFPCISLMEK